MGTTENKLVFIVDDDPVFLKAASKYLLKEIPELKIKTFPTGEACLHEMYLSPIAVVLDYFLNSEFEYAWNGVQVLKKIRDEYPATNVIISSSQKDMDVTLNCIREGAFDYVIKNDNALPAIKETILNVIDDAIIY